MLSLKATLLAAAAESHLRAIFESRITSYCSDAVLKAILRIVILRIMNYIRGERGSGLEGKTERI